jgi:hypothetical protein
MPFLRRLVITAARVLVQNPEARAKARQVLEEEVKPRAKEAWREARPEIERAGRGLKRLARNVRDQYRKGRRGD